MAGAIVTGILADGSKAPKNVEATPQGALVVEDRSEVRELFELLRAVVLELRALRKVTCNASGQVPEEVSSIP